MPPQSSPESYVDLRFPVGGVDLLRAFYDQQGQTTPVGINVRAYEPGTMRQRGGSRPGLVKFVDDQLPHDYASGSRLIQDLNVIVRQDGIGLLNNYPFDPPLITDPSDPGPASLWPPGGTSRVPPWRFPGPGTPVPPYKNGKATPVIVWANPADILLGTALSGTQLNAVAHDPVDNSVVTGTFVYNPLSAVVLPFGNAQVLNTVFTPTNTTKYNTPVKGKVLINVVQGSDCDHRYHFLQSAVTGSPPTPSGWSNGHTFLAFSSSCSTGSLLVVIFRKHLGVDTNSTVTVSDSLGTTFTEILHYVDPGTGEVHSVWIGVTTSAGANTVTANYSFVSLNASNFNSTLGIMEYSNPSGSPLDVVSTPLFTGATAGTLSTGSIAINSNCELVLGVFCETAGNSFIAFTPSNGGTSRIGYAPNVNSVTLNVVERSPLPQPSASVDVTVSLDTAFVVFGFSLSPGSG